MSDTPRTDAALGSYEHLNPNILDFARQLERELADQVRLRELDAKSRQALIEQADGYEDRALKAESAVSATGRSADESKAVVLLRTVRDEWYTFTGYSQLKVDIDELLSRLDRTSDQ